MTIVGKILVVLNLVFALVVGGFLTVDYARRTNWKRAYDELKRDMQVRDVNTETIQASYGSMNDEVKRLQTKLEEERQKRKDDKSLADVALIGLKDDLAKANEKVEDFKLVAKKAQAAADRLLVEVKDQAAAVSIREKTILKIEEDNRSLRAAAIANENLAKALQVRNENLQERLLERERYIAKLESGKGGSSEIATDPNKPNPPSVFVKGKINEVGKDGLVEISIGSDQGLKKYNTLEVYRLSPKAEYLGTVRVVEVYNRKAVGRLVRSTFTTRSPVRLGDIVASSLERP
jgi:hypothetical protein